MGILRQYPGQKALAKGLYTLTGELGQSAHRTVECEKGELLPLVQVGDDLGTLHWVLTVEHPDVAQAA